MFKEFSNPLEADYDITSGLKEGDVPSIDPNNPYYQQIWNLVGIIEDVEPEEMQEKYGITWDEYMNPTAETIEKIKVKIKINEYYNPYYDELLAYTGFFSDYEGEDHFGLSWEEYSNPTEETIEKVRAIIDNSPSDKDDNRNSEDEIDGTTRLSK